MRQALELALEALQFALHVGFPESSESQIKKGEKAYQQHRAAITAIKEAMAQPEQEPVATLDDLEQEIYENTRQFVSHDVMEWMLKRYYTTPPQRKEPEQEQEPVAVVDVHEFYDNCANFSLLQKLPKGKHTLYTTPPQRKPLTDEEIAKEFYKFEAAGAWYQFARAIEAAHGIKEKNT